MFVDEYGNTVVEWGDTILDIRNRIGVIQSVNAGCEDGWHFWEAMVYYPDEGKSYTTYRNEIKYVLIPFKLD